LLAVYADARLEDSTLLGGRPTLPNVGGQFRESQGHAVEVAAEDETEDVSMGGGAGGVSGNQVEQRHGGGLLRSL